MQIFCDFDGTISIHDTTDVILSRFAASEWQIFEEEWKNGKIGSAQCMQQQIALMRASKIELNAALDELEIDSTFVEFVRYCKSLGAPLSIISDGVDYFIKRILGRYSLGHLAVVANKLLINNDGTFSLTCPHHHLDCASAAGVCKCRQIGALSGMRVFIGDGRSDYCAAQSADLIFAKSSLAIYCEQQAIPYIAYENFNDVQHALNHVLTEAAPCKPSTYATPTA